MGELVQLSGKTVSFYERNDAAPEEFLRKCADALGVSYEEISKPPQEVLRDEPDETQDNVIPIEVLTDLQLESLFKTMNEELAEADGPRKKLLYQSISRMAEELKKRS